MHEKEIVEIMYKKHKKLLLNTKETAKEIGISYSNLSKFFTKENNIDIESVKKTKILPTWTKKRKRRVWKITEIAKWLLEKENQND